MQAILLSLAKKYINLCHYNYSKGADFINILNFVLNNKEYSENLTTRSTYHSNAIERKHTYLC